jgi:hypothetical protein
MTLSRFAFESRRSRLAAALGMMLLLATAASLVMSPPAEAKRRDNIPPSFAGLKSATTCIPGPIAGGRTTSYNLSWDPATDNVTPSKRIVYDVYQAETSGGEDFSTPTYTTSAGATLFATPPLPAEKYFYFVVRARDQAGNSDTNTVEREGQNLCV